MESSTKAHPFSFTIQVLTLEDSPLLGGAKYVGIRDRNKRAFFDLHSDPAEMNDLLGSESELAGSLDRILIDFLRRQVAYYDNRMWESGRNSAPLS